MSSNLVKISEVLDTRNESKIIVQNDLLQKYMDLNKKTLLTESTHLAARKHETPGINIC